MLPSSDITLLGTDSLNNFVHESTESSEERTGKNTQEREGREVKLMEVQENIMEVQENENNNNDDDEYEETLVYVELNDFTGQSYLSESKRIVLRDIGGKTPSIMVNDTEFRGAHTISLGSNHFFALSSDIETEPGSSSSSSSSSVAVAYQGHSINSTEFSLSRIGNSSSIEKR
jgi:hypothetical protein